MHTEGKKFASTVDVIIQEVDVERYHKVFSDLREIVCLVHSQMCWGIAENKYNLKTNFCEISHTRDE